MSFGDATSTVCPWTLIMPGTTDLDWQMQHARDHVESSDDEDVLIEHCRAMLYVMRLVERVSQGDRDIAPCKVSLPQRRHLAKYLYAEIDG